MAKDLNIAILMDFYGGLLTDKRYDAMDMYYNQDMSLAEIAEELDISRQGARDLIKHGERRLTELEETLGLAKRFADIKSKIKNIKAVVESAEDFDGGEVIRILNEMEGII